jgi:hypothetical protein
VHMSDEGMLPDNAVLSSAAKALAGAHNTEALAQDSNTGAAVSQVHQAPLPAPAAVWTMTDQQWRQLQSGAGSIHRRKLYGSGVGSYGSYSANIVARAPIAAAASIVSLPTAAITVGTGLANGLVAPAASTSARTVGANVQTNGNGFIGIERSSSKDSVNSSGSNNNIVSWFLGSSSSSTGGASSARVSTPPSLLPPPPETSAVAGVRTPNSPTKHFETGETRNGAPAKASAGVGAPGGGDFTRFSTTSRQSRDGANAHPRRVSERLYYFPELEWKELGYAERRPVHVISSKLRRHMAIAEDLMLATFPGLRIDLENPVGMSCPGTTNKPCPVARAQTLREIYSGWEVDPNKYTCRCYACGRSFVPRFTVQSSSPTWVGSDGPGTPLWCELLSPWTLRKELFNIIVQEGVDFLISANFRTPVANNTQHSVLFWNAVIVFRLFGLPFSFLFVTNGIQEAFPPKPPKQAMASDA